MADASSCGPQQEEFINTVETFICALSKCRKSDQREELVIGLHQRLVDQDSASFVLQDAYPVPVKDKLEQIYVRLCETLYNIGGVPDFEGREDIGYQAEHFLGVPELAVICMKCFSVVLDKLCEHDAVQFDKEEYFVKIVVALTVNGLLLSAEHECNDQLWTSESSTDIVTSLQTKILYLCQCESIEHILCKPPRQSLLQRGVLGIMVNRVQARMKKESWKQNPSISQVFRWCLLHTQSPYLSDHLATFLPGTLLLMDDFQVGHKMAGVICVGHILDNASKSELTWYGRGQVLYDALQHQLYTHDEELLEVLFPCLFGVLQVIEGLPTKADSPRQQTRYDLILERWLSDMELENRVILRRVYIKHLPAYIQILGITIVRHLRRLLKVLDMYIETYDGPGECARLSALDALETLIIQAWPRMHAHCQHILQILLKLIYDVSVDTSLTPQHIKTQLTEKATRCLVWLARTSSGKVENQLSDNLGAFDVNETCRTCIQSVLHECTK